jgi:ATP-dependent Lon protease
MTDNISILEKRLKKLENKVSTIKDNYEEMDNNIEDIYDTINNLKTLDSFETFETNCDSRNKNVHPNSYPNANANANPNANASASYSASYNECMKKNEKQISKYIDSITHNSTYTLQEITDMKDKCIIFYNKLLQNQPQIQDESLKEHMYYFIDKTDEQRQIILDNLEKVLTLSDKKTPRLFKILDSNLATYNKKIALNKLHILETMQKTDSEYFKMSQWLDTFLEIPFNSYKTPSYMNAEIINNPAKYLSDSRQQLDTVIYGQDKTKQHIIEILARMIKNPKTLGSVFAIYGEPGTGKTTLIKEGLSHVFGLPFIFISLGGAQDRSTLVGSNYVYEGSNCGKIIHSLKQSQCMNPIFYFDELDKISGTEKGNEIVNLLIHLTDYTQNSHFMDDYMDGIAIDLSRATFVFSFNDKDNISPILLDRMEIIKFNSYSNTEKMFIARDFLLPNVVKNIFNDDSIRVDISDTNMMKIIKSSDMIKYNKVNKVNKFSKIMKNVSKHKFVKGTENGGVRYIKKILERIVSRINLQDLENPARKNKQDLENAAFKKNRTKTQLFQKKSHQKAGFRKSRAQIMENLLVIDDTIINDIINDK